jgi:hypothetical protein
MYRRKSIRYLFGQASLETKLIEAISYTDLSRDEYDVLLAIDLVSEYTESETVNILTTRKFMRKFQRAITTHKFNTVINKLHEDNLIWINSLKTLTITKLGIKSISEVFEVIYEFEYHQMRPMFKALTSGVMTKDGDLIFPENLRKHNPKNPYNPYIGVHRLQNNLWSAYIKVKGVEIFIGAFPKPIDAAKARDKYIKENKLKNHVKSIKL